MSEYWDITEKKIQIMRIKLMTMGRKFRDTTFKEFGYEYPQSWLLYDEDALSDLIDKYEIIILSDKAQHEKEMKELREDRNLQWRDCDLALKKMDEANKEIYELKEEHEREMKETNRKLRFTHALDSNSVIKEISELKQEIEELKKGIVNWALKQEYCEGKTYQNWKQFSPADEIELMSLCGRKTKGDVLII